MFGSSPATFFESRGASSVSETASPRTYSASFSIPTTGEDCDRLLAAARHHMRRLEHQPALAKELARFLGANSSVWSVKRRTELRHLLAEADGAVDAVLNAVAEKPRADISDEAEAVLVKVLAQTPSSLSAFMRRFERDVSAASRASIVRAIGNSSVADAARRMMMMALADDDAEVRDAAATSLTHVGGTTVERALRHRLEREENAVVRESLQSALDDLSAG